MPMWPLIKLAKHLPCNVAIYSTKQLCMKLANQTQAFSCEWRCSLGRRSCMSLHRRLVRPLLQSTHMTLLCQATNNIRALWREAWNERIQFNKIECSVGLYKHQQNNILLFVGPCNVVAKRLRKACIAMLPYTHCRNLTLSLHRRVNGNIANEPLCNVSTQVFCKLNASFSQAFCLHIARSQKQKNILLPVFI